MSDSNRDILSSSSDNPIGFSGWNLTHNPQWVPGGTSQSHSFDPFLPFFANVIQYPPPTSNKKFIGLQPVAAWQKVLEVKKKERKKIFLADNGLS